MEEKKLPFLYGEKFKKRTSLEQITDIMGFRIILNNVDDCYKALGIFHSNIIVYLEDLKIIFLLQKLIIINQYIQLLLDQIKDQLKFN